MALTLHYSVLSIVLHLSRSTPGARYHASSAIALTEFFKIVVCLALVLNSGELRGSVLERRRLRWEQAEREAREEASEPAWIDTEDKARSSAESDRSETHELLVVDKLSQPGQCGWMLVALLLSRSMFARS